MIHIKKIICIVLASALLLVGLGGCASEPIQSQTGSESPSDDLPVVVEPAQKRVALTFDDGPHNVRTREIVDELDKYGFNATFFVVGNRVDGEAYRGGDTVKYAVDHGNEIGIHGYTHDIYYDECSDEEYEREISSTLAAIREYVPGYTVSLMRPVGGYISNQRVIDNEYSVIMWSVDSYDYEYAYFPDSEKTEEEKAALVGAIVNNVMSKVHDGAIILMHDLYLSTSDAVKEILRQLDEEGYEVVTVSELIGDPEPGRKYNSVG